MSGPRSRSPRPEADAYGWVSISLHWLSAIAIIVLWFLGQSISDQAPELTKQRRDLHVSLAVAMYLILVIRIFWRLRQGHPRIEGQGPITQALARTTHYTMLLALAMMLISGPLLAWGLGQPIRVFEVLDLPVAEDYLASVAQIAGRIHAASASTLVFLFMLHVSGAMKHLMFHDDNTVLRMLIPPRRDHK